MPETAPDEDRLFEEATDLIIRLQNDPENAISLQMVQEWRARSPLHEQVWAEVAEIHGMAGKVLKDQRSADRRTRLGLTRRNLVIGAGLGIGAYAAGRLVIPELVIAARADHLTRTAEIRPVALADGTMATLGPDSALALSYSGTERRVELLTGMCYFEVSKDRRPFRVASDAMVATALGTAFDVSSDAGYLTVSVNEGQVDLHLPGTSPAAGEKIDAGNWLTVGTAASTVERGTRDPGQVASWRHGLIVAERETVSAVVARIARWQTGRTMLIDGALGARRVNGVYDTRHPVSALEAVVHPFGGKVRQISAYVTVVSSF
ncbi:MAG: FecR domain-containing protein [Hyphomicrobiaceae bacterium]